MSIPDTIFILLAALVLFGPKKLPEIARQAGKLLAELRRASNEFKFQMEEELRQSDEAERRAKAEAAAAAAPPATENSMAVSTLTIQPPTTGAPIANRISPRAENPVEEIPDPPHPHTDREAAPHA